MSLQDCLYLLSMYTYAFSKGTVSNSWTIDGDCGALVEEKQNIIARISNGLIKIWGFFSPKIIFTASSTLF